MPAASEPPRRRKHLLPPLSLDAPVGPPAPEPPPPPLSLPHTWRPLGPRLAGAVAGTGLIVALTLLWIGFDDETKASFPLAQRATGVAVFILALVCLHALMRSRVVARAERLVVVNGYKRREYAYPQILAIHLGAGAPWATIDLADGTSASVMALQGSDGARAHVAVRQLRALIDAPVQRP